MNLYQLHDDPDNLAYADERCWLAVWANTPEGAEALYRRHSDSGAGPDDPIHWEQSKAFVDPAKQEPHVERRPEALRDMGWREEGERSCESCGLYPLGEDRFAVCSDCYQCRECGCECGKAVSP